jgi:hypothetical protein
MDNLDRPWLLDDRDVWVANPFYSGPPVPHPEDEIDAAFNLILGAGIDTTVPVAEIDPVEVAFERLPKPTPDDDIPF